MLPASYSVPQSGCATPLVPDGRMVSSTSAICFLQAPVLPEPGLLHIQPWRRSHSRRKESSYDIRTSPVGKTRPRDWREKMDTKPRDTKPTDLDLELAVF